MINEFDPCTDPAFAAKPINTKRCNSREAEINRHNAEEAERAARAHAKYGDKSAPGPCDNGYTLHNPEPVSLRYPSTSPGGEREALDSQKKSIPVSVLTADEAKSLMNRLKDLKEKRGLGNKNNRHKGCAQRAHLTACHLEKTCKLSSAKIFVEPKGIFDGPIYMQWGKEDNEFYDWKFHVGNLFYVKDAEGQNKLYVIDYFQDTENMISYDTWMSSVKKGRKEKGAFIPNKITDLFTANATYQKHRDAENRVGRACRDNEAEGDMKSLREENQILEKRAVP